MYTLSTALTTLNSINVTTNKNDTMDFESLSSSRSSNIMLILILSVLCFCGVIFMIFGPMMRSEAMNRVHNGPRDPNAEHGHQMMDSMGYVDV
ncbi:unnamed protein product [Adineta ricciae]|uniref:Uncharacterized protein n=1 Tax=Adineta ricciae TaxID=249248 RepID=A0A814JQA0_ADIRI|nr:unnamed protein product [Adineta ricciae]CAF1040899.1 unnamed protein product [Adineta ricciae]